MHEPSSDLWRPSGSPRPAQDADRPPPEPPNTCRLPSWREATPTTRGGGRFIVRRTGKKAADRIESFPTTTYFFPVYVPFIGPLLLAAEGPTAHAWHAGWCPS